MVFSYQKLTTLKPQKEKRLATFLVAMAVAACFFVPYMILSEGYFTFFGDFNVQQIPFYQMCHEAIREGNISWNWNTDLGANFVGSYAFYLDNAAVSKPVCAVFNGSAFNFEVRFCGAYGISLYPPLYKNFKRGNVGRYTIRLFGIFCLQRFL